MIITHFYHKYLTVIIIFQRKKEFLGEYTNTYIISIHTYLNILFEKLVFKIVFKYMTII